MSGEFDRIAEIVRVLGTAARGIGDDCAVLETGDGALVVSTDTSVEGVHFRRGWLTCDEIGWRAAAAALSDLAAEGATAAGLLVAVVVPDAASDDDLISVMRGVGNAAAACGTIVIGGDLSRGPVWMVTITVLGRTERPVTRSGARPGDGLWITGSLGGARAALESWRGGREPAPEARQAFAHPVPRVEAGRWLAARGAHAMIDLSDGLGGDAAHIAAASGVALELELDAVPFARACIEAARDIDVAPARFAAEGGEDYELLAVMPAEFTAEGANEFTSTSALALSRVGTVRQGSGVHARLDGRTVALEGFDHFR